MKRLLLLGLLGLCASVGPVGAPGAQADGVTVDVGLFFETLAPHGDWVQLSPYGWVWSPAEVDFGWRPYLLGRWVWADPVGWTWVSEEPFGWAVYHYGRWLYSDFYGWVWVPGTVWAPAWVEFRIGPGWVGWAPLPPPASWSYGHVDVSASVGLTVWAWNFVPTRHFAETSVAVHVVQPVEMPYLFRAASRVVRPSARADLVTIADLPKAEIEQARGVRIPARRLRDATDAAARRATIVQDDAVTVYRPRVAAQPGMREPPRRASAVDVQEWLRKRQEMLERHIERQRRALDRPPSEGQSPPDTAEAERRRGEARQVLEEERKRIQDMIERRRKALEQPTPTPPGGGPPAGGPGGDEGRAPKDKPGKPDDKPKDNPKDKPEEGPQR